MRITKALFISKDKAWKASGAQRNSRLGQAELRKTQETKRMRT